MVKSKIKDIFKGECFDIWEDGTTVTFALGFGTIAFPKEEWSDFKKDIVKLNKILKKMKGGKK